MIGEVASLGRPPASRRCTTRPSPVRRALRWTLAVLFLGVLAVPAVAQQAPERDVPAPLLLLEPGPLADPEATTEEAERDEPAPPFRIVVHGDNPIDELPAKTLSRIFLKKTKRWDDDLWPDGPRIAPFDLAVKAQSRKDFTRAVHDKSTGAIKSYWQREIFSGRDVPPDEVGSDEEMMEMVASNEGAIGYVSGEATIEGNLKVLEIADE